MTLKDEFACRNGALRAGKKTSGVYKIQSGLIYSFVIWKLFPKKCKIMKGGYVPRGQSRKVCFNHNALEGYSER